MDELFKIKQRMERNNHYKVVLECYMLEIYKSNLEDSLYPTKQTTNTNMSTARPKLEIMEDPNSGMVFVQNLTKVNVESMSEALETYKTGIKNRKVFSTDMNQESSRSHLIFSIVIETINNDTNQKTKGKISFIDLAGSERVNKSNPNVQRLQEAKAIN